MNMKKTIAAVAAGALAVSAMATSASALDDRIFTYSLVTNTGEVVVGDAAMSFQASIKLDATGDATEIVPFTIPKEVTLKKATVKVITNAVGEQNRTFIYSPNAGELYYNSKLTKAGLQLSNELDGLSDEVTLVIQLDCTSSDAAYDTQAEAANAANAGTIKVGGLKKDGTTPFNGTPTVLIAWTDPEKKSWDIPFQTGPYVNDNVLRFLYANKGYVNVVPSLNDAIENFSTITFTFNTATHNIKWVVGSNYKTLYTSYNSALVAAGGDESKITALYDDGDGSVSTYKTFTQHLYNGYGQGNQYWTGWDADPAFGRDSTGYLGFDWAGQNLFGGALVVNENLTMSLSDVDYFDYTLTSISFDWDAIMDGAATSNNYATYVQSLKLATSTIWYWDNLAISFAEAEEDNAGLGAGTTSSEEELPTGDEDPAATDEIPADEEPADEPEEPADEPEEPADEPEEPAQQEVVENPGTGNAPVALAVIPVALAAAAIVAKKRG